MSGHSKWSSIKHKKGAADAKRGQLFTKLSRAIMVAAKEGGPDPAANLALQNAIEKARSYSMPKDNIERAIAKGPGAGADGAAFETVVYEGYGPDGVAVIVEADRQPQPHGLRRPSSVLQARRHPRHERRGRLAVRRRGVVIVPAEAPTRTSSPRRGRRGADDVERDGCVLRGHEPPDQLAAVRERDRGGRLRVESAELSWCRRRRSSRGRGLCEKLMRLIDTLEENDDVQDVWSNFDIPEQVLEAVAS